VFGSRPEGRVDPAMARVVLKSHHPDLEQELRGVIFADNSIASAILEFLTGYCTTPPPLRR
jgi:hypothetical protein